MRNWPKPDSSNPSHKKRGLKPNLLFYSAIVKNETNSMTANTEQFALELSLIDNLVSNKQIGTGMAVGTTTIASSTNTLFQTETYALSFPKGNITGIGSFMNTSDTQGVLDQNVAKKYIFRICSGDGIYASKKGYIVIQAMPNEVATGRVCVYFKN